MTPDEWYRVNRHHPCVICDHIDWCTYTDNGACCMRVESSHPTKNGGWFHRTKPYEPKAYINKSQRTPERVPEHAPSFDKMLSHWHSGTTDQLDQLAEQLQLDVSVLIALGACYADVHYAYAFPMYLPDGNVVGIRLRNIAGEKWAVKGSKAGLFIPWNAMHLLASGIFICEGPTDTAAAMTLGFFAIGRPACLGQEDLVAQVIKESCAKNVYVCFDNDGPGVRGAEKLCQSLKRRVIRVVPPAKDLREFVVNGGTRELLLSMSSNVCTQ